MSHKIRKRITSKPKARARVFAALGDKTRLALVAKLCSGEPCSISQLADESKLTRQAITKHRGGPPPAREKIFQLNPEPLGGLQDYLSSVSKQWDQTLARLKTHVER